jgi:hypothetical protein
MLLAYLLISSVSVALDSKFGASGGVKLQNCRVEGLSRIFGNQGLIWKNLDCRLITGKLEGLFAK